MPNITLEQALLYLERVENSDIPRSTALSPPADTHHTSQQDPGSAKDLNSENAEYSNAEDYEFDESDDFNEAIDGMGFLTIGPRKSGYTGPQSGIAAVRFLRSLPTEGHFDDDNTALGESPSDSISSQDHTLNSVSIDEMVNDYFAPFIQLILCFTKGCSVHEWQVSIHTLSHDSTTRLRL